MPSFSTPAPEQISLWGSIGVQYGERTREGCSHRHGLAMGPLSHRGLLQDGEVLRPRWIEHVHLARHPVAPQHWKTIPQTGIVLINVRKLCQ